MLEMLRAGKHTIVPGVVEHATCANGKKSLPDFLFGKLSPFTLKIEVSIVLHI